MKAGHLSRGQRAGLCLAMTLAPEPELLVLDDPALGLDPVARRSLLQSMLYVTRQPNRTILFSSHLLSDVERVADRIVDAGRRRAARRLHGRSFPRAPAPLRAQVSRHAARPRRRFRACWKVSAPIANWPSPSPTRRPRPRPAWPALQPESLEPVGDDARGRLHQLRGRAGRKDLLHAGAGTPMITLVWKELRENRQVGAAGHARPGHRRNLTRCIPAI